MTIAAEYAFASGPRRKNCHWIAYRFREQDGFDAAHVQSWVVQCHEDRLYAPLRAQGLFVGLWRSDSGATFVAHEDGSVFHNAELAPLASDYEQFDTHGRLSGVWGLDDDHVFAWGTLDDEPALHLWTGAGFETVSPPGPVRAMSGQRDDFVVAVGDRFAASFDGTTWSSIDDDAPQLSSVFVTPAGEIWATGPTGQVLHGDSDGLQEVARHDQPLQSIAVHQDRIWVGNDPAGLFEVVDGEVLLRRDDLGARQFDARELLLVSCRNKIADTPDHESYKVSPVRTFLHLTRDTALTEEL